VFLICTDWAINAAIPGPCHNDNRIRLKPAQNFDVPLPRLAAQREPRARFESIALHHENAIWRELS